MSQLLSLQARMLRKLFHNADMPKIYLVHGEVIKNYEKKEYINVQLYQCSIDLYDEQIVLIVHFTLDLSVDELYPGLIGKGYDEKYNGLKDYGAPSILIEVYRIFTSLRNGIMHDPSSVIRTEEDFIVMSRDFRKHQTAIKIANKQSFELLLYVAYRISESVARFGMKAFDDFYNNLLIGSIYNHVLNYLYIKDRYGEGVKIDIPINISWYTRRWVSKDAHDLIACDGKLLGNIRPIKQTANPIIEQYDYVFEKDGKNLRDT